MAEAKPKVFEFEVSVDHEGRLAIPGGSQIAPGDDWAPDHLLVAALVRCSIASLTYHARRAGRTVTATGSGHAVFARRESDGRYALRDIDVEIEAELTPPADDVEELTQKAERDCFVGASLTAKPRYAWRLS